MKNDANIINNVLKNNIVSGMETNKYSIRKLARESGIEEKQIRRILGYTELGPELSNLLKIANALDISIVDLLTKDDRKEELL